MTTSGKTVLQLIARLTVLRVLQNYKTKLFFVVYQQNIRSTLKEG